ncbi:hypothetical protein KY284_036894 [Solanum tuberosum]|nr:hypothetical protein KY284_036894 [Solanum tuberosum]
MESPCKFEPIDLPALIMEAYERVKLELPSNLTTLVECECIEGKTGPLSKISQLIIEQDQLKHELEEMIVRVSNKDVEIALLKAELLKAQSEGPGTAEVNKLRKKNDALLAQNVALQEKLIKDNDEANAKITLVIMSLSHQSPSS